MSNYTKNYGKINWNKDSLSIPKISELRKLLKDRFVWSEQHLEARKARNYYLHEESAKTIRRINSKIVEMIFPIQGYRNDDGKEVTVGTYAGLVEVGIRTYDDNDENLEKLIETFLERRLVQIAKQEQIPLTPIYS